MSTSVLRAVTGTVRVLAPCGTLPGQPDTAEIAVNGTRYLCRCLPAYVELVKACGPRDDEPAVYHLPADLSGCDCADATYRRRQCKHVGAVRALKAAGKL